MTTLTRSVALRVYVVEFAPGRFEVIARYPSPDRPWSAHPFVLGDKFDARDTARRFWPGVEQEWTTTYPWAQRPFYL